MVPKIMNIDQPVRIAFVILDLRHPRVMSGEVAL